MGLHLLDWEGPSGPVVLFLHGGGLQAHAWDRICRDLQDEARCVALDLRGHGDSTWDPEGHYDLPDYAGDVGVVADALALRSFVIVGHSLGGAVGLTFAGAHPERVLGLALVDTGPHGPRKEGRGRVAKLFAESLHFTSLEDATERILALEPGRSREQVRRGLERNTRQNPDGTWSWKWDPRTRRLLHRGGRTEEEHDSLWSQRSRALWRAAAAVTCPVLIVRGGSSDLFDADTLTSTVAAFRHARAVTIAGAGHNIHSERPVELAGELRRFIREDLASRPGGS